MLPKNRLVFLPAGRFCLARKRLRPGITARWRESLASRQFPPFSVRHGPLRFSKLLRAAITQRQIHRRHLLPLRQLLLLARLQQLPTLLLPRRPDLRQEIPPLIVVEHYL